MRPSALLVMQIPPLASQPTHHTASLWAGNCRIDRPDLTSQMMALSSIEPETSMLEVGEKAIDKMAAVCPSNTCRGSGDADEVEVDREGRS